MAYGYPEGALERLQTIELELLQVVGAVCEELGIVWFADSGTCLGALRHGGFIPWDDDVDVGMRIEDYRTFVRRAPELLPEGYGLYTYDTQQTYPPLFAKVYKKGTRFMSEQMVAAGFEEGIFVDVFAYDRLSSDPKSARKQIKGSAFWQRMSYLRCFSNPKLPDGVPLPGLVGALCRVAHVFVKTFCSRAFIERRFYRAVGAGSADGRWYDIFYSAYGTFSDEDLFPVRMVAFENIEVPVPHNAEAYLATLYGAYEELPPEEKRGCAPPLILDFGDGVNVMEGLR